MIDIDCLGGNEFLKMLYPSGLDASIMIKDIAISVNGMSEFSFFVKQQPSMNIKKWGAWNKDFNCLWIKTDNYCNFKVLTISNLQDMGFNFLSMVKNENGNIEILSSKGDSELFMVLDINDRFIVQEVLPINI